MLAIHAAAVDQAGHKFTSRAALTVPPTETVVPKIPAINPLLQAWLLEGPLSAQVPAYVERLRRGRYASHTSGRCLSRVAHFAHWMSMCHLPAHRSEEHTSELQSR